MTDLAPIIVTEGTRQAVVDADGLVVNVIIAPDDFDPGDGLTLRPLPAVSAVSQGDTVDAGGSITATAVFPPEAANRNTIEAGLLQGLSAMQQILDAPQVTFSNLAGAQTACRDIQTAIQAEARQLRRLTRLALGLLDSTN